MPDSFDTIIRPPEIIAAQESKASTRAAVAAKIAGMLEVLSVIRRNEFSMTTYALKQDSVPTIELPPYDPFYTEIIKGEGPGTVQHNSGYNILAPNSNSQPPTIYDYFASLPAAPLETDEEIQRTRFTVEHRAQLRQALAAMIDNQPVLAVSSDSNQIDIEN